VPYKIKPRPSGPPIRHFGCSRSTGAGTVTGRCIPFTRPEHEYLAIRSTLRRASPHSVAVPGPRRSRGGGPGAAYGLWAMTRRS
jgi:hypothetical protein